MSSLSYPFCRTPLGISGRADLLVALALAENDADREASLAAMLGFEPKPPEPIQKNDDTGSVKGETGTTDLKGTQPKIQGAFRPYHVVALDPVVSQEEWQSVREDTSRWGTLTDTDSGVWDESYPKPKPTSIVPWTRLWPKLRQAVACRHTAGLDIKCLIDRLAKGEALKRLPRSTRLAWPAPLSVVLDFSDRLTAYWDDWHGLRQRLENSLHSQVRFYRLDGVPQRPLLRLEKGRPSGQFIPWPQLNQGETLMLVSDLGMVDPARSWPRECWQRTLTDYQHRGIRVMVLAPISTRHLQPALVNRAATVRLSPDSSLRPCARLLMQSTVEPKSKPEPYPGYATLLTMMSVATRIEPALLRELRCCLPDDSQDAGLEGEVWCHPELDTAATACALASWAAPAWQQKFNALPPDLQQRTLDCLRSWHAGLPQMIHYEETLLWQYLADKDITERENDHAERALNFFINIINTLRGSDGQYLSKEARSLLVQMADRHVEWVGSTLGKTEHNEYINELSAAVALADPERVVNGLPSGVDPIAWLQALPPQTRQTVRLLQLPDLALAIDTNPSAGLPTTGVTLLANLNLDRPALLWAWEEPGQTMNYRPWYWETSPADNAPVLPGLLIPLREQSPSAPKLVIHTGFQRLLLEPLIHPTWATAWGHDSYGLYADLDVKGIIQRFRWLAPGTFLMGSPESERDRYGDETQHVVTLTRGFWLADSACTQALWTAVTGENPSRFQEDANNPVESVSWENTRQFIERLNGIIPGLTAQLPTEAQWEYACRAGTTTPFSFGDNITPEQVNYHGEYPYADGAKGWYREKTVPVKSLPPNPWGLYEMHGNVWEWCADWYQEYDMESLTDPKGPVEGSDRVLRGGSWSNDGSNARSADRGGYGPVYRNGGTGFRLALG